MFIVIEGNPVDGLNFYGPFEVSEDASEYANFYIGNDWWIAKLDKVAA